MQSIRDENKVYVLKVCSQAAGAIALIGGVVIFAGWLLQSPFFITSISGHVTTKANTAFGVALCGLALLLINRKQARPMTVTAIGGVVAIMGALTLVEWQTSINLGLDQFFCKDVINAVTIPAPGRMAPSTAICFVLMGVAIASLQQSDKKRLFGYLLTTSTLIISLLGLTSTMYGVLHIFSFQALTEMALPTAVFFSLISIGTLFAYPEFGLVALLVTNTTGGEAARRFLPACILMPIVLGRVILAGQTSGLYTAPFAAALQTICLVIFLTLLIWWVSHIMTLQDQSRQIDQERKAAIARAQAESRFKSEFLADMSHEIRTPMNGILGMTEILLRSGLNEKQLGFANIMKDAGNALLAVINDILDYSKIDAGRLKIEKNDFKLTDLVEGVADLLSIQASNKRLSLLTFIDPKIPTYLHSDAGRIRQILTNLAGNAIKFSDKGEILIRVSMESSTSEAENTDQQSAPDTVSINFAVTDNGIGMSDDEVRQLFQPFVQLSAGLSRPDGTGLGLTICKKLVELMDGTISVHSVKGHGTTFSFLLKMEVGQKAEKTDILEPALKDIKVLIVDDETAGREILHEYLDAREIKNDLARSGQEALEIMSASAARADKYDIVIIDLVMPSMTGLQLAKHIREDATLRKTALIMVTAFDKPGIGEEALSLGLDAYLTKPIKQSRLLDCMASLLSANSRSISVISASAQNSDLTAQSRRSELILVADDHSINLQVATLQLRLLGFEADTATDGASVVDMVLTNDYDLIFMDCEMPVMDGFQVTKEIREKEKLTGKHTIIVAMTAHIMEDTKVQCMEAGMDDYLSKPAALDQMRTLLDKWLPVGVES